MINTSNLRLKLEEILKRPIDASSNEYLKKLVNYNETTKFANLNYLITQVPDDVDGLVVKKLLSNIAEYLGNASIDTILVRMLRNNGTTVQDLIEVGKSNVSTNNTKNLSEKVKRIINSDVLKLGEDELRNYLTYQVSTKQIIEHIYGDANA